MKSTRPHRSRPAVTTTRTALDPADERKTSPAGTARLRRPGRLNPGSFGADVARSAAPGRREQGRGTIRIYTDAARWFAAAHLLAETNKTTWEQVEADDVRRWVVWLLGITPRLRLPAVPLAAPVLPLAGRPRTTSPTRWPGSALRGWRTSRSRFSPALNFQAGRACRGNSFEHRRDAAILAVFLSTGIRLTEMAGIRHHPDDLTTVTWTWAREIRVRGKGGKPRTVKISHEAARRLDRYLRVRSRHELAYRPQLWLGVMTAAR